MQQAIAAMQAPGDRRYEVYLAPLRGGQEAKDELNAIIDTRSPGSLLLLRHRPPGSTGFRFGGRDQQGAWAITADGRVVRTNAERHWPPFVTDGGESLLVDSMDRMLERLTTRTTLARSGQERLPDGDGRLYDRITATRDSREGPLPHRFELWIDTRTSVVERVEYRWDPPAPDQPARRTGPGSLKAVTFKRVDTPPLPNDWYTPEGHAAGK